MTQMAVVLDRRARAVELALAGVGYDAIAEELGYAQRSGAWKAVRSALGDAVVRNAEEYRQLELARLDRLQEAHWDAAVSGEDLKAAELCIKLISQRGKLLGLDAKAPEVQHRTLVIGGDGAQFIRRLREVSEA